MRISDWSSDVCSSDLSLLSTMALCLLMACQRQTPMQEAALRAPVARPSADLVEEPARDPARLKTMRRQCRENRPDRAEELCIASALAARRQFLGGGKANHTPEHAALSAATLPPSEYAAAEDVGLLDDSHN